MLIAIFYQVILILGDSVLLGDFELGYYVLDVYDVGANLYNTYLTKTTYCMADMNADYIL